MHSSIRTTFFPNVFGQLAFYFDHLRPRACDHVEYHDENGKEDDPYDKVGERPFKVNITALTADP